MNPELEDQQEPITRKKNNLSFFKNQTVKELQSHKCYNDKCVLLSVHLYLALLQLFQLASRIVWTCLPKCNRVGGGGPVSTGASGEGGRSGRDAWHPRCFESWTQADAPVGHRLPGVKRFLCTHPTYTHMQVNGKTFFSNSAFCLNLPVWREKKSFKTTCEVLCQDI